MNAIIRLYWQICRLKLGPDAVPTSSVLLLVTSVIYVALTLGVWVWVSESGLLRTSVTLLVATTGWLGVLWGIMVFMGKVARYRQTITELFGINIILVLFSIPLRFAVNYFPEGSQVTFLVSLISIGLFVWGVFIEGFIYHRALDISPVQGNLLALAMSMGIMAILG